MKPNGGETLLSHILRMALPSRVRGRSVIDVGCGLGCVVREAIRCGAASVTGIDTDEEAIQLCEGLPVRECSLSDTDLSKYDVVTCNPTQMPIEDSSDPSGRAMIESLLCKLSTDLRLDAVALVAHSEVSDPSRTMEACISLGLVSQIVEEGVFDFQETFSWLDAEQLEYIRRWHPTWVPKRTRAVVFEITREVRSVT